MVIGLARQTCLPFRQSAGIPRLAEDSTKAGHQLPHLNAQVCTSLEPITARLHWSQRATVDIRRRRTIIPEKGDYFVSGWIMPKRLPSGSAK